MSAAAPEADEVSSTAIPEDRPASDRPPILLFLADGISAMNMTYMGYRIHTTPTLNMMMDGTATYLSAYAPSPWTVPSVASMLTSLYPSAHTLMRAGDRIPDSARTLAEYLKEQGYETALFSAHPLVGPRSGLGQGFDWFEEVPGAFSPPGREGPGESSNAIRDRVLKWIDSRESSAPFFVVALTTDPLEPFGVASAESGLFLPKEELAWFRDIRGKLAKMRPGPLGLATVEDLDRLEVDPGRFSKAARAVYDGSIRYTDRGIKELREALEERELWEKILFMFTSTRGFELGERGSYGQGASLHDQAVRVPALISFPALWRGPQQLRKATDHVDIFPTLVSLANLELPEWVQGVPRNLDVGGEMRMFYERAAFAETVPMGKLPTGTLSMIAEAGVKMIVYDETPHGREHPEMELYRGEDPMGWEKRSVVASSPRITPKKRAALNSWRETLGRPQLEPDSIPPDPPSDLQEVLRSLGYLQGLEPLGGPAKKTSGKKRSKKDPR